MIEAKYIQRKLRLTFTGPHGAISQNFQMILFFAVLLNKADGDARKQGLTDERPSVKKNSVC
jgi:hypothetical protein